MKEWLFVQAYDGIPLNVIEPVSRKNGVTVLAMNGLALKHIPEEERGYREEMIHLIVRLEKDTRDEVITTLRQVREEAIQVYLEQLEKED